MYKLRQYVEDAQVGYRRRCPGLAKAVSCCFPIVGLILYFVWQNERPRAAKAVCQWAVLGVILGSFLYLVSMCAGYTFILGR